MDYKKLLEHRNESNEFAKRSGIRTTVIREGYAQTRIDDCMRVTNPIGSVHGGCLYTLADVAAGSAASSHGQWAVTLMGNMNYLKAGNKPKTLSAETKEIKCGRTIAVYEVSVWQDDAILLATGTFTMYFLDKKIEL